MRHGWAYIYGIPPGTARFQEISEILPRFGITLERPATNEIARIGPEGERIVCAKSDIVQELGRPTEVAFQLWVDFQTDVFCAIEELEGGFVRESFGLDGKTIEESIQVVAALMQLFELNTKSASSFAFVVDESAGLHRDFHWDDFVVGGVSVPPEWPLVLGFSKGHPLQQLVQKGHYSVDETKDYVLFRKRTELGQSVPITLEA